MRPIDQSTILVTGATDGLGRALAGRLHAEGAQLLLHGRDRAKLDGLREELAGVETLQADFASLDDVRRMAAEVRDVDVLVNNAGIGSGMPEGRERAESKDGHELRFQVNYLAGYLLTELLLDRVRHPGRIVLVSSLGQMPIDFDDVMLERSYTGVQAYCQSKLALVMFTFDLAEELEGTGATANCLHPGTYMPTNMVLSAGIEPVTALEDGVAATMRLITSPEVQDVNGHYFDGTSESAPHAQAEDPEARRLLRELSAELTGVQAAA
jgi:NAD(P)-dependent dehydrogenase (short-subunit alcohol dehydrogenase family)